MNQELEFIGICETIKSFGALYFGKRHHPWIRHVSIVLSDIDAKNRCIPFIFYGASTCFKTVKIFPLHSDFDKNCLHSREALEDELAKEFIFQHFLDPDLDIWDYANMDELIGIRQLVYQDYKFAKAKASMKFPSDDESV